MTPTDHEFFRTYCVFQGFDLSAFDAWLSTMGGLPIHEELAERRLLAFTAARANEREAALRHLEWMLLRWHWIKRVDAVMPLAKLGSDRSERLSEFAVKGNIARTKYTPADKETWRTMIEADADLKRLYQSSKIQCAKSIATRLGLEPGAFETVRKAI